MSPYNEFYKEPGLHWYQTPHQCLIDVYMNRKKNMPNGTPAKNHRLKLRTVWCGRFKAVFKFQGYDNGKRGGMANVCEMIVYCGHENGIMEIKSEVIFIIIWFCKYGFNSSVKGAILPLNKQT